MAIIQKNRSTIKEPEPKTSAAIETHLHHLGAAGNLYEGVVHSKRSGESCARDLLCEARTKSRGLSTRKNASRAWNITTKAPIQEETSVP